MSVTPAGSFASDYAMARSLFLEAATASGGRLDRVIHPEVGPDGDVLSCDLAWFGPASAENVLVTISGTHGVEGFAGSGAQVDWLRRGEAMRLPPGCAVLLIHAINPYGFAWLRRVTHENIDLNRNWIDFSAPLPENQGYDALATALLPNDWSAASRKAGSEAIVAFARAHGTEALSRALYGGQYRHASGLYYGGDAPSWSRRTQTDIFDNYLKNADAIAIIDVHTGLGPWGFAEQIVTQPRASQQFRRARAWFGAAVTSTCDGTSAAGALVGDGLTVAPDILRHASVTPMALEIGTLPGETVLESIAADNWLHARGDPRSPQGRVIKQSIKNAFFVERDDWKGMVSAQFLAATRQALAGLKQTCPAD